MVPAWRGMSLRCCQFACPRGMAGLRFSPPQRRQSTCVQPDGAGPAVEHAPASGVGSAAGAAAAAVPWVGGPTAYGPAFEVHGSQIEVLETPEEFYATLSAGVRSATDRIGLGSLYIGTGPLETALIEGVKDAVKSNPSLRVQLLVDHSRGTRGQPSSANHLHSIAAVAEEVGSTRVEAAMYLTPRLTPLLRRLLRPPFTEVLELNHGKIYFWDNTVLLTGANLSHNYFTDRQDRYVVVKSPVLADFMSRYLAAISAMSTQLGASTVTEHPLQTDQAKFRAEAVRRLAQVVDASPETGVVADSDPCSKPDTVICPLVQAGSWGVRRDEAASVELFSKLRAGATTFLATGLTQNIVTQCKSNFQILTAAPAANGFLGARGILGHIPAAYTHIATKFLRLLRHRKQDSRVQLFEYERAAHTFHAKGLWGYDVDEALPSFTFVGSPNFGERSANRDLECQLAVFTNNAELRQALHDERVRLYSFGSRTTLEHLEDPGRKPALWESLVTRFIGPFF